jgi:hypothetical protein
MDLLISWKKYETKFKGETITMELLPLKVEGYSLLSPYMRKYGSDEREQATQNALDLQAASTEILRTYVRNIKGITINGEAPTPDILSTEIRLTGLVMDIIQTLIMRSLIGEGEEKNLELLSDDLQTDATAT